MGVLPEQKLKMSKPTPFTETKIDYRRLSDVNDSTKKPTYTSNENDEIVKLEIDNNSFD